MQDVLKKVKIVDITINVCRNLLTFISVKLAVNIDRQRSLVVFLSYLNFVLLKNGNELLE